MTIYDGQLRGNILVVRRTGCGKIYFLQKIGLNNFFGKIVKTEWVSGTEISEAREAKLQSCFSNEVEFYYAPDVDSLKLLIERFKLGTENIIENNSDEDSVYGENKVLDLLIVMDDVSGIADFCKEFANFLTVSRKYRYHCIYAFHIIIPEKEIRKKFISQTNIFNIFPSSVPFNTVSIIFQSNCVPTSTKYVPVRPMWLTRVFRDLTSQDKRNCLTIDCTNVNPNGPARYRTKADNPEKQVCYFNETCSDQVYNIFTSKQIKGGNFEEKKLFHN